MKLYKTLHIPKKEWSEVKALKVTIKEETFPQALLDLSNLEELYLEGNCIRLPHYLNWPFLKILSLRLPACKTGLVPFFNLPCLENFKIIETPLSTITLPLGNIIAPLNSLMIKDCGLREIPEEIGMLSHLTELNLSYNQIKKLPYAFRDLKNLKRLNLDSNQFEIFPDEIKHIKALRHLSIDNNLFSEEEKNRIQREFYITPL